MFRHFFWQHRKAILPLSLLGYVGFHYFTRPGAAYQAFPLELPYRYPHPALPHFFRQTPVTRYSGEGCKLKSPATSLEPTVLIDARFWGAPRMTNADQSISELDPLSGDEWPQFLETATGDITLTFAHRKAFGANNTLGMTHAVVYASDSQGQHAIFGYLQHRLVNDSINTTVSRDYTLYQELTIKGARHQAADLMQRIDDFSKDPYNGIGCNCYTPIIAGFIAAKSLGFTVPHAFEKSLLVVIPGEQNYGFGVTPNRYLRPFRREAVAKIKELEDYLNDKQDEFKQFFKPK